MADYRIEFINEDGATVVERINRTAEDDVAVIGEASFMGPPAGAARLKVFRGEELIYDRAC